MTANQRTSNLAWVDMSDREQAIWAAHFARQGDPSRDAAGAADRFVLSARELELDSAKPGPEFEAAMAQIRLTREQFYPWYRVPCPIQRTLAPRGRTPTDDECAQAYERYAMGRADFY